MKPVGGKRDRTLLHDGNKIPELSDVHRLKASSLYMKNLSEFNFISIFHMVLSHVSIPIYTIERGGSIESLRLSAILLILFLSACQSNPEKEEVQNMNRELIEYAEQGNTEQVRQLLQSGADINATDEQEEQP